MQDNHSQIHHKGNLRDNSFDRDSCLTRIRSLLRKNLSSINRFHSQADISCTLHGNFVHKLCNHHSKPIRDKNRTRTNNHYNLRTIIFDLSPRRLRPVQMTNIKIFTFWAVLKTRAGVETCSSLIITFELAFSTRVVIGTVEQTVVLVS